MEPGRLSDWRDEVPPGRNPGIDTGCPAAGRAARNWDTLRVSNMYVGNEVPPVGPLKDLRAEAAQAASRLPDAAAAAALEPAGARRGRHELSPELSALITASIPANTRKAWRQRYENSFRPWAAELYGEQHVMPPTDEMLSSYMQYLGYERGLMVSTLTAHLGTVMGVTRAWVDQQCALRATWRAGRAEDRRIRHEALDAAEESDAAQRPADAGEAVARDEVRRLLDLEAAADVRHEQAYPRIPATRLAHRTINAYSGELARNPAADTATRKASGITVEEYRKIVTVERAGVSTAVALRDKALLAVWYAISRRSAETSRLATTDIDIAKPHGMRVTIRFSKTDTHGRKEDVIKVPYAKDPTVCPVRAVEDWLAYLKAPADPDHPEHGPRYALSDETKPLWPRIDREGRFGIEAWARPRKDGNDDGGLSTMSLSRILDAHAIAAHLKPEPEKPVQPKKPRRSKAAESTATAAPKPEEPGKAKTPRARKSGRQISTHSMRRGPITAALNKGKKIEVVARHAGFAPGSRTIYEYWEQSDRGWEDNALDGLL